MINRIKDLLSARASTAPAAPAKDQLQVAAAALLVEAARLDDDFDDQEWTTIHALVRDRFALTEEEAEALIEEAEREVQESVELYGFARIVKDRFDHAERVQLIEMLWEVVYADGTLHHYEANLLRRIAGLIYVSDRESGSARKRVLARLSESG